MAWPQHPRYWDQNTTQIQILLASHFEKKGRGVRFWDWRALYSAFVILKLAPNSSSLRWYSRLSAWTPGQYFSQNGLVRSANVCTCTPSIRTPSSVWTLCPLATQACPFPFAHLHLSVDTVPPSNAGMPPFIRTLSSVWSPCLLATQACPLPFAHLHQCGRRAPWQRRHAPFHSHAFLSVTTVPPSNAGMLPSTRTPNPNPISVSIMFYTTWHVYGITHLGPLQQKNVALINYYYYYYEQRRTGTKVTYHVQFRCRHVRCVGSKGILGQYI